LNVEIRVLKASGSAFSVTYVKNSGGKKNLNDCHVGLKNGNLTIDGDTVK
jgi:hypothetical protein